MQGSARVIANVTDVTGVTAHCFYADFKWMAMIGGAARTRIKPGFMGAVHVSFGGRSAWIKSNAYRLSKLLYFALLPRWKVGGVSRNNQSFDLRGSSRKNIYLVIFFRSNFYSNTVRNFLRFFFIRWCYWNATGEIEFPNDTNCCKKATDNFNGEKIAE